MEQPLTRRSSVVTSKNSSNHFTDRISLTRAIASRLTTDQQKDADSSEPPKGSLGLTLLHKPPSNGPAAVVDLIFVHGLNGGSQSTWTKGEESTHFWPKCWLSTDEAFRDVRIHTFGYSSGVSKESILNLPDFSRALLSALHDTPNIPRGETAPLILVGHSMGGLVIKKAHILACQIPEFEALSKRIKAIFFLGTPHQGADIAKTIHRILSLAGSRPFLGDLSPHSPVIESINEEFPRISSHLKLFSFFESKPISYGLGNRIIVDRHSAVLNYTNERRTHLDANHKDVARYSSPNDPSYVTVRNALAAVIEEERYTSTGLRAQVASKSGEVLSKFLGIQDAPEDDLMTHDSIRLPGSCEWLLQKRAFLEWRYALHSKLFWLSGRPGAGKSVVASYATTHLQGRSQDTSYFFFTNGDKGKDNINSFLRSMAYQMASMHPSIMRTINEIASSWKEVSVDKVDHSPIWRKIFLAGILKVRLSRPQYWVIDSIDECHGGEELMTFLFKAQEVWPLCIFVTSRCPIDHHTSSGNHNTEVLSESISEDDTNADIALFLESNLTTLHLPTEDKQAMIQRILRRSMGCFLWVYLIQKELRRVHTATGVDKILDTTPSDMNDLYKGIVADMSRAPYDKHLAGAILDWTVCCFRPLVTEELHIGIQLDTQEEIGSIERLIEASCGSLVFVDKHDKVHMVHLTATEFLTRKDLESEFRVSVSRGHQRIALACLRHLCGAGPRGPGSPQPRRPGLQVRTKSTNQFVFTNYASEYLFQHIACVKSSDYDDDLFRGLASFLGSSSVLQWIEHIARNSDVQKVFQGGKTIGALIRKRTQWSPPLRIHKELTILDRFASDLTHIVTKFGRRLRQSPSSIHRLIPPFCPPRSAIYLQFCSPYRGVVVQGLSTLDWDDCLSTITYPKPTRPLSVALSGEYLAVGTSAGTIRVYDDETFQECQVLDNIGAKKVEPVWRLEFGATGEYLAAAGSKSINVWSTETWSNIFTLAIPSLCLAIAFADDDTTLYAALKNNQLLCWDLDDGELRVDPTDWTRDFDHEAGELHARQPSIAKFCSHLNLLAIAYRGEDLILWDLENDNVHDVYDKETGSRSLVDGQVTKAGANTVYDLVFSAAIDSRLLAVTYADGDLVVYDLEQATVIEVARGVCAQVLASSIDGRTLATGDARGSLQLYDFETLKLLYRVQLDPGAPGAKSLAFTVDSLRLVEIRGRQCRIWGPSVLLRQDADDEMSDTMSLSTMPLEIDHHMVESPDITAMACVWSTPTVYCGKEDGSVHVYDMTGELQDQLLFTQGLGCAILFLHLDVESGLLTVSDAASRVTSRKISKQGRARQAVWTVSPVVIETKSKTAISQIIAKGSESRLLVSSESSDDLWGFGETGQAIFCVGSKEGQKTARWASHPTNPDLLILMQNTVVQLHLWSTFECVTVISLVPGPDHGPVDRVVPRFHQHFVTTIAAREDTAANAPTANKVIQIWDTRQFTTDSTSLLPTFVTNSKDVKVEEVAGIFNDRLIFLDSDYWICSLDINPTRRLSQLNEGQVTMSSPEPTLSPPRIDLDTDEVTRHFFLPYDWIGLVSKLEVQLGKGGEIFFVHRSEVAVIKKGFSVSEQQGLVSGRRASSPGFKSPLRSPLRPTLRRAGANSA